jgi:hypothetical protein
MDSKLRPKQTTGCAARVQFLFVYDELQQFIKEGYSLRAIYDHYKERKIFTMNIVTFYRYINKNKISTTKRKISAQIVPDKKKNNSHSDNVQGKYPHIIETTDESFKKETDLSKLF